MGKPNPHMATPMTESGYEQSDARARPIYLALAVLSVSTVLIAAIVIGLFWLYESAAQNKEPQPAAFAQEQRHPKGPLLQSAPRYDLQELRRQEQQVLHSTQWIDQQAGTVRIPIDRAIELVAERGFPDWPKVEVKQAPNPQTPNERQALPTEIPPSAPARSVP
jgi:hypothetical protein